MGVYRHADADRGRRRFGGGTRGTRVGHGRDRSGARLRNLVGVRDLRAGIDRVGGADGFGPPARDRRSGGVGPVRVRIGGGGGDLGGGGGGDRDRPVAPVARLVDGRLHPGQFVVVHDRCRGVERDHRRRENGVGAARRRRPGLGPIAVDPGGGVGCWVDGGRVVDRGGGFVLGVAAGRLVEMFNPGQPWVVFRRQHARVARVDHKPGQWRAGGRS